MRFLILGAGGMAGHVISIYLRESGHEVVGFARRDLPYVQTVVGDAFNAGLIEQIINDGCFDVIVNAIGILNKAADERKDRALYLNGFLPHQLARMTKNTPTRVFHMSTDCVFAGNTGPYTEKSIPDGLSFYDRSKAIGELNDAKNLTLRNSIVGPDVNENGIGLFNWFMKQSGPVNGFTKAKWTGMTTLELAKAMEYAAGDGSVGLVNMVPEGNISKFELLELFNESLRGGSVEIRPSKDLVLDKTLVRTNFDCGFVPKPYREQIKEMADWVYGHRELYPHYGLE